VRARIVYTNVHDTTICDSDMSRDTNTAKITHYTHLCTQSTDALARTLIRALSCVQSCMSPSIAQEEEQMEGMAIPGKGVWQTVCKFEMLCALIRPQRAAAHEVKHKRTRMHAHTRAHTQARTFSLHSLYHMGK